MMIAALSRHVRITKPVLWAFVVVSINAYVMETAFCSLPCSRGVLFAGIIVDSQLNNQKLVDYSTRVPLAPHFDFLVHEEPQQRLTDAN